MIYIMESSVISVSLLMPQPGDWLMYQRVVISAQGTLRGSTNGLAGPSHNLTQGSGKPGTWAVITPKAPGTLNSDTSTTGQTWGSCWTSKWTRASNALLEELRCPGLHLEEWCQEEEGDDSSPLLSTGRSTPGVLHPALRHPYTDTPEKVTWALQNMSEGERLTALATFSPQKKRFRGNLINGLKFLKNTC